MLHKYDGSCAPIQRENIMGTLLGDFDYIDRPKMDDREERYAHGEEYLEYLDEVLESILRDGEKYYNEIGGSPLINNLSTVETSRLSLIPGEKIHMEQDDSYAVSSTTHILALPNSYQSNQCLSYTTTTTTNSSPSSTTTTITAAATTTTTNNNNYEHNYENNFGYQNYDRNNEDNELSNIYFRNNDVNIPNIQRQAGERLSNCTTYEVDSQISSNMGERSFKCSECNEDFKTNEDLQKHHLTHTSKKPHSCQICGKSFCNSSNLIIHNRVHSGERPYQCQICVKNFRYSSNLIVHNRVHSGERPYQCQVCGRKFTQKGSLKNHFRIHSGEKPFSCLICGRKFSMKGNLKKHLRIH